MDDVDIWAANEAPNYSYKSDPALQGYYCLLAPTWVYSLELAAPEPGTSASVRAAAFAAELV